MGTYLKKGKQHFRPSISSCHHVNFYMGTYQCHDHSLPRLHLNFEVYNVPYETNNINTYVSNCRKWAEEDKTHNASNENFPMFTDRLRIPITPSCNDRFQSTELQGELETKQSKSSSNKLNNQLAVCIVFWFQKSYANAAMIEVDGSPMFFLLYICSCQGSVFGEPFFWGGGHYGGW